MIVDADVPLNLLPPLNNEELSEEDRPVLEHLRLVKSTLAAKEMYFWLQINESEWLVYSIHQNSQAAKGKADHHPHGLMLEKMASDQAHRFCSSEPLVTGGLINEHKFILMAIRKGPAPINYSKALLRSLCEGLVARVEKNVLELRLNRAYKELEALGKISKVMSLTGDFSTILGRCIEQINNVIGAESGGVLLYEPAANQLVLQRPAFGVDQDSFSGYALEVVDKEKPGMGAAVRVFITGQPYISNCPSLDPINKQEIVKLYGVHCVLTVPLVVDNRRLGVLHLVNRCRGSFNHEDARLTSLLAAQLAVVIDNARLFAQLEAKNKLLQRAIDIHDRLTQMVLQGRDMQAITYTLAGLLDRAVQVDDYSLRLLAFGSPPGATREAKHEPEEMRLTPETQQYLADLQREQRPLPFPEWEARGLKSPRVMSPIRVGGETFGYVSILGLGGVLEDLDFVALEHAATVYALQFMRHKVVCEVEERIKGQFIEDLVYGRVEERDILHRAFYLGYNLDHYYQVLTVQTDKPADMMDDINADLSAYLGQVLEAIRCCMFETGFRFIPARTNPMLILVDTGPTEQEQKVLELAELIRRRVKEDLNAGAIMIGIGSPARGVHELQVSYKQAEKAFRIAGRLKWRDAVVPYDSIGVYQIFLNVSNQEILKEHVDEKLGSILAYDREKEGHLLETMKAFIDCNFNLNKTAQYLFIHLNTLKYRIQRIKEIGRLNFDDPEQRFSVHLAVKLLDILDDLKTGQE